MQNKPHQQNFALMPLSGFIAASLSMIGTVFASILLYEIQINNWLTWGTFTYSMTFLITNLTNQRYGPSRARQVVYAGFVSSVLLSVSFLGWRSGLANGTAFLLAQLVDIWAFERLRRRRWWFAPLTSSVLGSTLDTALFYSFAFAGEGAPWTTWAAYELLVQIMMAVALLIPYRLALQSHASKTKDTLNHPFSILSGPEEWRVVSGFSDRFHQVILEIPDQASVDSKFGSLALFGENQKFLDGPIVVGTFSLDSHPGPYIMIRLDHLTEELSRESMRIGVGFYRAETGGLLTFHFEAPTIRKKLANPFLEICYGLDNPEQKDKLKRLLDKSSLQLTISEAGGMFGQLECKFDRTVNLDEECKATLQNEFQGLLKYHASIKNPDFKRSMEEFWAVVPNDRSPIIS